MAQRRQRKHWGWGFADEQPSLDELRAAAAGMREHLGYGSAEIEEPVALERVSLPAPRVEAPSVCPAFADDFHRARFALGCSYVDVVRGVRGDFAHPPDAVLDPRDERELEAALEWADGANVAVVPVGGGTSVVGGIEPRVPERFDGAVSLSLAAFDALHELDVTSGAARLGAGLPGPAVEERLREHGLTMRFYPQSFELSTLGGWIVTRAGGHFATGPTHVDDLVESVRAITPAGVWESRRLPGSGAGPSPDRMLLGSEGTLGVVTGAWLRVQPRPTTRWAATLAASSFAVGAHAVRALMHDGLLPATCRLIDAQESRVTGTLTTGQAALVLGFESYGAPIAELSARALELCRDEGLDVLEAGDRGGAGEAWRSSFVRAPYTREQLILLGVLVETFETAITWDRFDAFVAEVTGAATDALHRVCGAGTVTCRLTHVYPDGAAPYFTVMAPARRGSELEQWDEVKAAASDAVLSAGGTITHHHAVGRDHHPWYAEQRPTPFAAALRAAKRAVDPAGILNPGVIATG